MGKDKEKAKSPDVKEPKDLGIQPEEIPAQLEVKQINNPDAVSHIYHPVKRQILQKLIDHEYTIRNLSEGLKINPGTIKKYLDELLTTGLVVLSKNEKNEYGITLKYYRTVARKFIMHFEFPENNASEKSPKK